MTSLVFMFEEVPLPVWKMSTTNWLSTSPSATFWAASMIACATFGVEQPEVEVDLGGGFLDQAECADHGTGEPKRADGEVQLGAARLGAEVGVGWNLHRTHGVAFGAGSWRRVLASHPIRFSQGVDAHGGACDFFIVGGFSGIRQPVAPVGRPACCVWSTARR